MKIFSSLLIMLFGCATVLPTTPTLYHFEGTPAKDEPSWCGTYATYMNIPYNGGNVYVARDGCVYEGHYFKANEVDN